MTRLGSGSLRPKRTPQDRLNQGKSITPKRPFNAPAVERIERTAEKRGLKEAPAKPTYKPTYTITQAFADWLQSTPFHGTVNVGEEWLTDTAWPTPSAKDYAWQAAEWFDRGDLDQAWFALQVAQTLSYEAELEAVEDAEWLRTELERA